MAWRKTRWGVLVVAAAFAAEGCTGFGENCSTNADCIAQNPASVCDPTLNVCFLYAGPVVTDIVPVDHATGVAGENVQVAATFSLPIVDAGVSASTFQVVGQGFDTFGSYLVDTASLQATFEPLAGALALGTEYAVHLTDGIVDGSGRPLLPFNSTFSTRDGAFGQGGTLRFSTQTGSYTMAENYVGNIITAVDIYTGGGTSFDYELSVGISDAGSTPAITTVLQNIVGQEVNNLSVAIATDGTAFVAWTTQPTDAGTPLSYTTLVSAYDPRAQAWSPNTTVTGPAPTPKFAQVVAFNAADGDDGLVVWLQTVGAKQVVYGNYHRADAGWLGANSFQTNNLLGASNVSVAADFAGDALIAWQSEQSGSGLPEVLAVYSPSGGSSSPPVVVSNRAVASVVPQVALGITGLGAVVWPQQTLQTDGGIITSHVFASTFDPTLGVGTAVQLDSAATFANFPQVGVAANGNVFVIWQELGAVVTSTYLLDAGSWSSPVTLDSDPTFPVNGPAVVVDPGGNAIAAWLKVTPDAGYQMFGGRYTVDGGWHGTTQLTVGADPVLDIVPTLAVDATGRSFALETRLPGDTLYLEYIPFK
jgi:hypothetical protein